MEVGAGNILPLDSIRLNGDNEEKQQQISPDQEGDQ